MAKQLADIHTSPLIQAAVYHFCQRRLLDRHQVRALKEYGKRRDALLDALRAHMPAGTTWTETRGGFSLMLTLPDGLDAAALLPRAQARGVTFTPGNAFFVDGGGERMLRLSFSSLPVGQVAEGVRRLAEAIREHARHPGRVAREPALAVPLV
jgi:DNA-binding transcriptional MocR family regulator